MKCSIVNEVKSKSKKNQKTIKSHPTHNDGYKKQRTTASSTTVEQKNNNNKYTCFSEYFLSSPFVNICRSIKEQVKYTHTQ